MNNPKDPDLLTEIEYPDGTFLKFSYYAGGLRDAERGPDWLHSQLYVRRRGMDLTKLTDGNGDLIVQYTYDNAGNLTQTDNGNGTQTVDSYDAARQRAVDHELCP